ncbi:hypothetical protein ABZX30_12675 [Streptomyces sp. NPDC004542]|uniref:hypothetical protein n=1 Tax=Streptomyces sp. NPDC004542 TaxID=3154281 RepID=UPI0033B70DC0
MAGHEASRTPSRQPLAPQAPLTPAWLRTHFDPLPFPERMSALARYARALAPDAYETLRQTLDTGDRDERHTALFLAVVRRDLERVADVRTDPLLGRRARAAAIRLPVPEHALERVALSEIRATRHDTFGVLRLSRRHALAARLLPRVHERYGRRDAAALLPACPAETAAVWLSRLDPSQGVLSCLARTAPRAVAGYLAAQSEAWPRQGRHRFTTRYRAVASIAAHRDPGTALLLLERAPALLTPQGILSALRRPAEAAAVLRAAEPDEDGRLSCLSVPTGALPPSVRRALRELPAEELAFLAERCPATGSRVHGHQRREITPDALLALLPAADRRRVAERRLSGGRRLLRAPLGLFAALTPADRADLIQPRLDRHSSPWLRARLAAALPLSDAEPVLRNITSDHRSHLRALAWPALLACAELDGEPEEFARIAADCERAWHDHRDVRHETLEQLAGAAPRLLAALPERVLRDAVLTTVQSRDTTPACLAAAERLLRRVVEQAARAGRHDRAVHGAELLGQVVLETPRAGAVAALNVDEKTARAIWGATSGPARNRPDVTVALAELLTHRLTVLPGLDSAVRQLALTCDDPELAARAAAVWLRPPHLRERRCAELVALDATFATLPVVLRTLTVRRTDLLDTVLTAARERFTGRLRPRPLPWAPKVHPEPMGRWLPRQREAWAGYLARVAADETAPLRTRADAAALLRDPQWLTALAQDAPQPVAAAALTALGEATDRTPETARTGLRDLLLQHAGTAGERGRAALAALRRLLERARDRNAVALLAPVAAATDAPVGTRKEAVR